jgi:sugar phosphate permease
MLNRLYASTYYRWVVVGLLFVAYTASTVSTNSLPIFYPNFRETFGWTHAQVSEPASYYFIFIACAAPLVGFLLARFSPKLLMAAGFSLALLATLALTRIQHFEAYFAVYIVLSLAITSSGLLPSMVIITNWFDKGRGLAVGIFLLGSSIGGIVFPEFARHLMQSSGDWRFAITGVALLAAVLSFGSLLLLKSRPDVLEPDATSAALSPETPFSLLDAFKTPAFWLILLITAAFWFCGFGVLSHLQLYLADCKFDFAKAVLVRDLFFVFSIIGKIAFGYFSDRFDKRDILIFGTVCLIGGIAFLNRIPDWPDAAYYYAVIYGFGYSGAFTMIQLTVADYYKGAAFSKVLGFVSSFDALGGFLGVRLLGLYRTADGNYAFGITLLFLACSAALVMGIALRFLPSPGKKTFAPLRGR